MKRIGQTKLTIKGIELRQYCIIIASAVIALSLFSITSNLTHHVAIMWGVTIVAVLVSGFDLLHPYFWFSLFFTLYSTANAILWNAGLRVGGYDKLQIFYPLCALLVVLLIVGPRKLPKQDIISCDKVLNSTTLRYVIIILTILLVLFSLILHMRGYSSKVDMRSAGDLFYRFGNLFARFLTIFALLYIGKMLSSHERSAWKLIAFCGIAMLLFTLFTSERDVVFRYAYTILLLLFAYGIIKPKHLVIIFPVAILAMVFSVVIKSFFLRSVINTGSGNILYDFLSSDFTAAGGNLQFLLENSWTKGALGIKTYFTELLDPFLIGIQIPSPDHWFNYEVHTGLYKGYAFTLVGTGYAIAGFFGILLVFITVGIMVRVFYRRCSNSLIWLASYIYLTSTIIFSFRQSLQTITGSMVDHVGLAVVFCIIIDRYRISFGKGGRQERNHIYSNHKM